MTIIGKLWSGLYSLPKAFWEFYCVGFVVVYFAIAAFVLAFMPSINLTVHHWALYLLGIYVYRLSWRLAKRSHQSPFTNLDGPLLGRSS
jgi:hypothetical protein